MATVTDILTKNIVLVTDNINPSVFNMLWFVENSIYSADEIFQDSICVPGFTSISTIDSQITIVPNQVQLAIKSPDIEASKHCVYDRFKKLVTSLSVIPVKGIGINFVWKVYDDANDMHTYSANLFGRQNSDLHNYFSNPDSRIGAYFSQNVDEKTRLKLDIKPVATNDNNLQREFLLTAFNYHSDANNMEMILAQLDKWEYLFNNSKEIVCLIH